MGCSNCFNGCADIISDQCVKYTGVDIPGLGIVTGDPLLVVENQIIEKILELMTGQGIIPIIDPSELCPLVADFLPVSGDITLNHVISALFQSICNLDSRVTSVEGKLTTLNADYAIGCLSGVSITSDTHDIVQATINKLCEVEESIELLAADLETNYVLISEIDSYIASYISTIPATSLYNSRMIPYTAVAYFGVLTGFFDITGAGIGDWLKIYLCNGQNGTPDLRGRVLVGATTMGSTAFNPAVDPGIAGNPAYALNTTAGANQVALTSISQIPPHNHAITTTVNDPGHTHNISSGTNTSGGFGQNVVSNVSGGVPDVITKPQQTGLTNINITATSAMVGGVSGHANIQPVHATNYIIYIP